jgi:PAS domain S-box-containing protein
MLWLFLLAAVTLLVISRRRLRLLVTPLDDALYSTKVAVEHVHSGVGWVLADGKIGTANQSLADSMGMRPTELLDRDWYSMFAPDEHGRVKEAYTQMLLSGISSIETKIVRADGSNRPVDLRVVAVHDHRARLVGHHCMLHDQAQQRELEIQVSQLSEALAQAGYKMVPVSEEWL